MQNKVDIKSPVAGTLKSFGILFKPQVIKFIAILTGVFFLIRCSDFVEDDLSDEQVEILAPADSLVTPVYTQTFWWNSMDDADRYNLEIVTPDFNHIERFILDTNVSGNSFEYTFTQGTYQWRVTASNSSSYTMNYFVRTLFIDSTLQLTGDRVVLLSPSPDLNADYTKVIFKWELIDKADYYELSVKKESWEGEPAIPKIESNSDTVSVSLPEGKYVWGVQAFNDISLTIVNTRNLIIDTTPPKTPQLISPVEKDTVSETPVRLSWNRPAASTAFIFDSILIAKDSLFTGIITEEAFTGETFYNMQEEENGTYFWKVKSMDAAGNKSIYSPFRRFMIEK